MDSNLLKTDKCSPLVAYLFSVILFGIMIYLNYNNFKKFKNTKLETYSNNVFTMYTWNEVSLLLVVGVVMFGLCQYNQELLAWLILFIPAIVLIFKIYIIYSTVSGFNKYIPSDDDINKQPTVDKNKTNQEKPNSESAMFNPLNNNVPVENKTNMVTNLNKPSNLDNRSEFNPPLLSSNTPSPMGSGGDFSTF
jgi:hypothetical protein